MAAPLSSLAVAEPISAGSRRPPLQGVSAHALPAYIPARQPLFWAALVFAAGLSIGRYAWRPPLWWAVAIASLIFAALFFLHRRPALARVLALGACALTGAFVVQNSSPAGATNVWLGDGEDVTVIAHIISEGNVESDGYGGWRQRLDIETEQVQSETRAEAARFGIRLSLYSKSTPTYNLEELPEPDSIPSGARANEHPAMRLFRYGERVRFAATLRTPRNFRNPGAFDYAGFLHDQGISATASAKYSEIELLAGFAGSRLDNAFARVRRSVVESVHRLWSQEQAALIDAMLVGERSFIERSVKVNFQRSGTYHMLVVAGLHVGILAAFVLWTLRRLRFNEVVACACAMLAIFAYAELTKQGTPVWRAALMFAAYLITRLLYRKRAVMNALGAAALALLVWNPESLFGASFQMSFLCVLLIAGVGLPILERSVGQYARGLRSLDALAYDRSLPPRIAQFRLDLRLIAGRVGRLLPTKLSKPLFINTVRLTFGIADLIVLSTVMQLGMALPMAYYFHRATSVSIAANVLAVPLLQVLMPAAVVAVGLSYVSSALATVPAAIAGFALSGIAGTVHWLGGMRIADARVPTPAMSVIIFASSAILASVVLVRQHRRAAMFGVLLLVTGTICVWYVAPHEQIRARTLELTAIDVGQGDSLFLATPDGHKLLVDGGGLPSWMHSQMDIGEDVVSPYLWARGISHLDAIAVTHAHADHMAGFLSIIPNFRPRELWLPETVPQQEIQYLLRVAQSYGLKVTYHGAGDSFLYGGALVRVLAPDPDFPVRSGQRNDESLIMKVSFGTTSVLLEADAERGTERLVARAQPQADVLKVAHHGSASATNADFLNIVRPRFAVISVGGRNVYHHPRLEVLRRLQEKNVLTYRTDIEGATSFYLDSKSVIAQVNLLR